MVNDLPHSPTKEIEICESEKALKLRQRQFNATAKRHTHKQAKQGINPLLTMGQQVLSHLREQGSVMCNSVLRRSVSSLQMSPASFFFTQPSMLNMRCYSLGCPLDQLWSAVPADPSQLLVHPQPCHCQGSRRRKKQPWLCLSTTQQYLRHPTILNTIFSPNSNMVQ